ncbi:MAG: phosphatase PAP2 family protein [Chloroflexi bacterium]|nr:phosphatase PAP2 family protein [Chloroflexota bacterium]
MSNPHQQPVQSLVEATQQEASKARRPWYYVGHVARFLFIGYAIQILLFAALASWVHQNPVSPLDVTITRELQEHPASWVRVTMLVISYPGSSFVLPLLVVTTVILFWVVRLRLEAVMIGSLSLVSAVLNALLKVLVARPRPDAHWVEVFQTATGNSFPSGHVMAYLAFWGLLFSFGILLFRGVRWWRITLLIVSALFVVLVGPSRVYLGDHWASDVLGSYLIGGVLLGVTLWLYLQLKQRGILTPKG